MQFGFDFHDLHDPSRLRDLDRLFREQLKGESPELSERFEAFRARAPFSATALSAVLVDAARPLSRFLSELFEIQNEREESLLRVKEDGVLFRFRWSVFQKRSSKKYPDEASVSALDRALATTQGAALVDLFAQRGDEGDEERRVARTGWELHDLSGSIATPRSKEASYTAQGAGERLAAVRTRAAGSILPADTGDAAPLGAWTMVFDQYVGFLRFDPEYRTRTKTWASFFLAKPVKFDALVPSVRPDPSLPEARFGLPTHARARDGFDLT